MRLGAPEIGVPDVDHTHEDGDVVLERGLLKVDVHVMESAEELLEDFASKSNDKRQAHRRVDRVAAADPIPKAKSVFGVDAKLFNTVECGRNGDKVLLDASAQLASEPSIAPCAQAPQASKPLPHER